MNSTESELSNKTILTPGDYVQAILEGTEFDPNAVVATIYGEMSPEEITSRTARKPQESLTPGSWSG